MNKGSEELEPIIIRDRKLGCRWARVSTKVNGETRERLGQNGAPQFVGRPEGELQWQADVCGVRPSRTP
ncbi:unnamed protein product [Sphagnum troendelagicum]|uniref:Uncharacterized protein n=1 Tax=Sphagnum troendelagicum TaxID=128251 RepID=A0ABP0USP9_9BRYO